MTKISFDTWCPLFPGFYGTFFECDEENEIYNHNSEHGTDLSYDDFEFDYDDYHDRVASAFCDGFERAFSDILPIRVTMQKVSSPKYYNFHNDTIDIEVELDFDELMRKVVEQKDILKKYIAETYTSRDGFISHHSNDIEDWCTPAYILEKSAHRIGALLEGLAFANIDDVKSEVYEWAANETCWVNYKVKSETTN
jgi:hypothetical protein